MEDLQDRRKYYVEREDGLFFTQRGKFVEDKDKAVRFISRETALDCLDAINLRYGRKLEYKVKPKHETIQENNRSKRRTKSKLDKIEHGTDSGFHKTVNNTRRGKSGRGLGKKSNQLDFFDY